MEEPLKVQGTNYEVQATHELRGDKIVLRTSCLVLTT
jgi:hypothetical protein